MRDALHVITPEYLPALGGVATYTRQIASALTDAGETVHVWCPATARAAEGDRFSVHPDLGNFGRSDLRRAGRLLDAYPAPRRLLVQWVPHGYGRRAMNVPFCFWLWRRAAAGDRIELMVHEPFLSFWEGSWRQTAGAAVHRFMTAVLLRSAHKVWMATPAWEGMWRPYALGRAVPFVWLPIPSALPQPDMHTVREVRASLDAGHTPIVGHLGTYGWYVASLLNQLLPRLLQRLPDPHILLIGKGGDAYKAGFVQRHPEYESRLTATGTLDDAALAAHVAACDVLVQPYDDGVTSRRTTAMAGLRLGVPVVTTRGRHTETFWDECGAAHLTDVGDHDGMVRQVADLLSSAAARTRLTDAGRELYARTFDVGRTVAALTS